MVANVVSGNDQVEQEFAQYRDIDTKYILEHVRFPPLFPSFLSPLSPLPLPLSISLSTSNIMQRYNTKRKFWIGYVTKLIKPK